MNQNDSISLKEHFESRFQDLEKATERTAAQLDKRLEGMNEFRDTLKDQASKFVTRNELSITIDKINVDIRNLNTAKDVMSGKASQSSVLFSYAIGIIGILIAIFNLSSNLR